MTSIRKQKKKLQTEARLKAQQASENLQMIVDPTLSREELDVWGIDDDIAGATVQVLHTNKNSKTLGRPVVQILFKREIPELTKTFENTYHAPARWLQPLPEAKPE